MFAALSVVAVVVTALNVKIVMETNHLHDLSLKSIEAASLAARSNEEEAKYIIKGKDCSVSGIVDAEGYITVMGRKFKAAGISVGGTYEKTWTDASRDCSSGGNSICNTFSCGQFYATVGE